MKTLYKILLVSLLLCIGFVPNPTGANFEPARTTYTAIGTGPGNYSILQYTVENQSDEDTIFVYNGTYYDSGIMFFPGSTNIVFRDTPPIIHLMGTGHKSQIPVSVLSLFFPTLPLLEK
jgi:hypothetical protein